MSDRRIEAGEVRRIARLARLELRAAEVERLTEEMGTILGHLDALGPAEPREDASLSSAAASPTRPDLPGSDPLREPPERWAPYWAEGFFVVPRLPAMDADGAEAER